MFTYVNMLGCNETKSKNVNHKLETADSTKNIQSEIIHIQFIDKPKFNSSLKTKTRETGRLEYIVFYDDLEIERIFYNDIAEKRTTLYVTPSNQVIVRKYFSYFEFQDFLVHKGDSLIMSFDENKPVVVKYSRYSYAPQDFNIENSLNKRLPESYLTTGMADDTKMVAFKHFYDDPQGSKNQRARDGYEKGLYLENLENNMGKMLIPNMDILNNHTQQFLDSLNKNKLISDEVYAFYQQKYSNLLLKLKIMSSSIDSTLAVNEISKRFKKQHFHDEYFNQCLNNFEKKYFTSKAKWTVLGQYNLRDPKESFTFVDHSTWLSPEVKEKMLFMSLNKIDLFFHDDIDNYLIKFKESISNKTLIEKAELKFQKVKMSTANPSNLHLLTLDRKQTTIEEILQKNKGKVIYIDFWASWCRPCIEEMKYSKNYIQKYRNDNLAILFFSLDDNYQKWSKATERLEINFLPSSFNILDIENSKFIKEHKLKTIPRYMIVNKQGVLVNSDAIRPSDPKISKIFDELLKSK